MAHYPETFQGFASQSHERWTDFELLTFRPKPWSEDDVDIEITHCGICGSDVHMISGGWKIPQYPLVVGHEVAGIARRVGRNVQGVQVGDVVGCGAQIGSCGACRSCRDGHENYCLRGFVDTYDGYWPDGTRTQGGYADYIRVDGHFVFKIPDALSPEQVAPMLCGGLTVFAPLVQNGCGKGKKVGIVGIGGLGHYAVQFAAALGAEVWAISHSPRKRKDCLEMGASHFVDTSRQGWHEDLEQTLDLVVSTSDCDDGFPLKECMSILRPLGRFMTVGMPNKALPTIKATDFLPNGCTIGATHIGNRQEALAMLEVAAKHNIRSWIQTERMSSEGCQKAIESVARGGARYRWVLIVEPDSFPTTTNGVTNGLTNGHT